MELKNLPDKNPTDCQYCNDYRPISGKTFQSHALSKEHIQNVHNYVQKNESQPEDDEEDECHEVDMREQRENDYEKKAKSYEETMKSENRVDSFQAYTMNTFPQKSLMVGEMNWVD